MLARSLLSLGLLFPLAACGGHVVSDDANVPRTDPPKEAPHVQLFAAHTADDALVIAQVDPARGEVKTYGAALPAVRATTHKVMQIWTNDAGSRAYVLLGELAGSGGGTTLLAGEGGAWRVLESNTPIFVSGVSPKLDLVWLDRQRFDDGGRQVTSAQPQVIAFDGTRILSPSVWYPFDGAPKFRGFSPDATWFTYRAADGRIVVHKTTGEETTLREPDAKLASLYNDGIFRAFATSLVIADAYPTLRWIDLDGKPITVDGFMPSQDSVWMNGYQIDGGELSLLTDRAVTAVQKVPADLHMTSIAGQTPDGLMAEVGADSHLAVLDRDGIERARFTPAPLPTLSTAPGFGPMNVYSHAFGTSLGGSQALALVEVVRSKTDGDEIESIDRAVEMWRPAQTGDAAVTVLAQIDQRVPADFAKQPGGYQIADDGASVVWVEDGGLQRIDTRTLERKPLATDLRIDMVTVSRVATPGAGGLARE